MTKSCSIGRRHDAGDRGQCKSGDGTRRKALVEDQEQKISCKILMMMHLLKQRAGTSSILLLMTSMFMLSASPTDASVLPPEARLRACASAAGMWDFQNSKCLTQQPEMNTDRPGRDYRDFDLTTASPEACRAACNNDRKCSTYTYVKPGVQGPKARCWLKEGIPAAVASNCCVSGVLRGPSVLPPQALLRACASAGATWDFQNRKCLRASASTPADTAGQPTSPPETTPEHERTPIEADNTCGPAGGRAIVAITEPHLNKLRVRAEPDGRVLATIPEGFTVSIVGVCQSKHAAGFRAQPQPTAEAWCRIDVPVAGCVKAEYLQLVGSDGGAAGGAEAAGVLRNRALRQRERR